MRTKWRSLRPSFCPVIPFCCTFSDPESEGPTEGRNLKRKIAFFASRSLISPPPFGRRMTPQGSCDDQMAVPQTGVSHLRTLLLHLFRSRVGGADLGPKSEAKMSVLELQNAHFAAALWAADDLRGVLWGPVGGLIDLHFALSYRSATPFRSQSRRG